MDAICNVCKVLNGKFFIIFLDEEKNEQVDNTDKNNINGFIKDLNKLKKKTFQMLKPIDIIEMKMTLFKSLIMPELAKGIRFVFKKF
jgi:exonuclease I